MPLWLKIKVTKLQLKNNCREFKNNYNYLSMSKIKKRPVTIKQRRITWESIDLNGKFNLLLE